MEHESFTTESPDQTREFGRRLAGRIEPGAVVGLIGDLGSGKTCLVQAVCEALGVCEHVTSPTFILVNEYAGRDAHNQPLSIYHFDLYRLLGEEELLDLGSDDYFYGDGVCLVEWADMAASLLPTGTTMISIQHTGENSRLFDIKWGAIGG